jgi:hypothetical protein
VVRSYGNISVKGAERQAIIDWLAAQGIDAFVGPDAGDWTTFTEATSDAFDLEATRELMIALTGALACDAVAAAVHNADVLGLIAARQGRHVASYISYPGFFTGGRTPEDLRPQIAGIGELIAALACDLDEMALKRVLGFFSPDDFIYPLAIHADLVRAAGLPGYSAGFGYRQAEAGAFPGNPSDFVKVPK